MRALDLVGIVAVAGLSACKKDRGEASLESVAEAGYEMSVDALFRAAESDDLKALKAMLEGGMELGETDGSGRTVLHAAAGASATKSIDFLLDRGMAVDVVDAVGRTPLMEAVIRSDGRTVRHLLAQGADPRAKESEKYKPLMLAVREGRPTMVSELAPYVREDLDDALLVASILGQAEVIDELTNYGASVYARLKDGRTPLMLAAQNGRGEAADMLLAIGANRFGMDEQGRTAADLARAAGHEELASRLAGAPVAGDFELMEPAELGAAMVELMEASQPPELKEEEGRARVPELAGIPDTPPTESSGGAGDPSHAGSDGISASEGDPEEASGELKELEGAIVGVTATPPLANTPNSHVSPGDSSNAVVGTAVSSVPIVMRSYREKELPLRVDSTTNEVATLRVAGGDPVGVSLGELIPGSSLQVIRISRRMQSGKNDGGNPTEVSVVSVKDSRTGVERELVVGLPALAHDPVALVEDGSSGSYFMARTGQRFRSAEGCVYLVGDVRPNQIVIEDLKTGETTTLPLRGPRG